MAVEIRPAPGSVRSREKPGPAPGEVTTQAWTARAHLAAGEAWAAATCSSGKGERSSR